MASKTAVSASVYTLRWVVGEVVHVAADIERDSAENNLTLKDIKRLVAPPENGGLVLYEGDTPVGLLMYTLDSDNRAIDVHNLVVKRRHRRKNHGTRMLNWLLVRMVGNYDKITLHVRESNLDAHLFLKAVGFKAIRTVPRYFKDTWMDEIRCEDSYYFENDGLAPARIVPGGMPTLIESPTPGRRPMRKSA